MVGCHHQLNGHEFEQAPGAGDGQGSLACCRPWGHRELDKTEQLNNNNQPKSHKGSGAFYTVLSRQIRKFAALPPAEFSL